MCVDRSSYQLSLWLPYRNPRYFSGILTAILSGFITYIFLEPMFDSVGMKLGIVALWILSINATFVGMCLGVLLPLLFPGICLGINLAVLVGCFINISYVYFLPAAGGGAALAGAFLSAR